MDSPAPALITLLLIGGTAYQFCFRYEHWTGGEHQELTYERDNLTGETHLIHPGEKIGFLARLTGDYGEKTHQKHHQGKDHGRTDVDGPTTLLMIEDTASALKGAAAEKLAQTIPIGGKPVGEMEDLNHDGTAEQVIQTKTANDGLMDISVVSGGKELFYGRGKNLKVLPTQRAGWSDLSLQVDAKEKLSFRYNPSVEGYEAIDAE